jgi:hypothetical protein
MHTLRISFYIRIPLSYVWWFGKKVRNEISPYPLEHFPNMSIQNVLQMTEGVKFEIVCKSIITNKLRRREDGIRMYV